MASQVFPEVSQETAGGRFKPAAGLEVHGYVLLEPLGEGGFGEVWRARGPEGSVAALKFHRGLEAGALAALCREAKLLRRLGEAMSEDARSDRPPIAALLGDFLHADPPALAMECVDGGNLRRHVERRGGKPMGLGESLRVVRDAAEALAFAHRLGITHRDLSPENMLLDPLEGRWKVTDFGVGSLTVEAEVSFERSGDNSATSADRVAGKLHYMSPEQRAGRPAGPPADIYALGVLWGQLLTGRFGAGLPATWARKVPEKVRPLMARCLEDDPAERWASGSEFLEALDELTGVRSAPSSREGAASLAEGVAEAPGGRPGGFRQAAHLEGHRDWVIASAVSPDGRLALTGGLDRLAILWDLEASEALGQFHQHRNAVSGVAFSPSGKLFATAGWDGHVRAWHTKTLEPAGTFSLGPGERVLAASFANGGSWLVAASRSNLHVWDVASGELLAPKPPANGKPSAPNFFATCATLSADGSRALLGLEGGDTLVAEARYSPSASERFAAPKFKLEGHAYLVSALAFSPNGRRALTAGLEDVFELWDLDAPKGLRCFEGHEHWTRALAFSPDGSRIASSSRDRTVRLWNPLDGSEIARHASERRSAGCLSFSPDGKRLVAGFDDGAVILWDLPENAPEA